MNRMRSFISIVGVLILLCSPLIAQGNNTLLTEADSLFTTAKQYSKEQNLKQALGDFESAAFIYWCLPKTKEKWIEAIKYIAYMHERMEMFEQTISLLDSCFKRYLIHSINAGNAKSYAYLYAKYIRAHEQLGNYSQAFEASTQALEALNQPQFSSSLVEKTIFENILDIRGRMAYRLGDYQMAMLLADSVAKYFLDRDKYDNAANALLAKNSAATELKKYNIALAEYRIALTWPLKNQALRGQINNNIGYIYLKQKEYLATVDYARQALEIYQSLLSSKKDSMLYRSKLETHILLGLAYREMQAFRDAEHHIKTALECIESAYSKLERVESLRTHVYLGQLYLAKNQTQKALATFQQGLCDGIPDFSSLKVDQNPAFNLLINQEPYIIHALAGKGNSCLQLFDQNPDSNLLLQAIEAYSLAFEVEKTLRLQYAFTDSKLHSGEINRPYYENAIRTAYLLYHEYGQTIYLDHALKFMEANKAFVLWESMNQLKNRDSISSQSAPQPLEDYSREDIVDYLAQRDALVISYFVGEDNLYYLAYHDDWQEMRSMPLVENFHTGLQAFVQSLAEGKQIEAQLKPEFYRSYTEQARYWYTFLLQDILEAPRFAQQAPAQLILLTDGILADLPFEALLTDEYAPYQAEKGFHPQMRDLPFLIKKYRSRYAYSINTLLRLANTQYVSEMDYVGFAPQYSDQINREILGSQIKLNPLPSTTDFVSKMAQLMQGEAILRDSATLKNFKQYTENTNILQLVMHGEANDSLEQHSWLAFSYDQSKGQGLLFFQDIIGMKIQSNLLLLTACQSGKGRIRTGEGKMSLSRAFVQAGCPNVVNSLWDAEVTASTKIMGSFLQKLQQGIPVDEALRQAKLEYIQSKAPYPSYWSNFRLIGGDQIIKFNPPKPDPYDQLLYYLGALLILVAIALWFWRRA